jgi:hypothetical protein
MKSQISKFFQLLIVLFLVFSLQVPTAVHATAAKVAEDTNHTLSLLNVDAKEGDNDCVDLDMIFIVDQSSSMSALSTQEASDPFGEREYAVESMIDLMVGLVMDRLALDQCSGTTFRIGVISFGFSARVDLDLNSTIIAPQNQTQASELRSENGIKRYVVADNLDQTNPMAALDLAYKMFWGAEEIDEGIRKKVIVFLTDGIPSCDDCPSDPYEGAIEISKRFSKLFSYDPTLQKQEVCLQNLREKYGDGVVPPEETNQCLDEYRVDESVYEDSIYLWTVFLQPPGYSRHEGAYSKVINVYDEMSRQHGGIAIELQANSPKDVPGTFRKILSSLVGVSPTVLQCGNFAVNPYLKEMRLTVYKIDPDIRVTLSYYDIDGNRQELSGGQSSSSTAFNIQDYYSFGPNEEYILQYPMPGIWQLTADNCNGLDMYYESITVDTSGYQIIVPDIIPQYGEEPFYDAKSPFYIKYEIRDNETGNILSPPDHPRFAGDVLAVITQPDGKQLPYAMSWDSDEQKFISNAPLQVPAAGSYSLNIVGSTYYHLGKPAPVESKYEDVFIESEVFFEQKDIKFEVSIVIPYSIKLTSPQDKENLGSVHGTLLQDGWNWPLKVKPISVQAMLVDAMGEQLRSPANVLVNAETPLYAEIEDHPGTKTTLVFNPEAGTYEGQISGFTGEGSHNLILTFQSDSKDGFRAVSSIASSEFSRADTFINRERFYQALLGVLIALIVLRILICLISNVNPVQGWLVIMDGSSELVRYSLGNPKMCGKNKRTIGVKELAAYPQLDLKKIEIRNLPRPKRDRQTQEVDPVFSSMGSMSNHPGIKVKFWSKTGGKPYLLEFQPDVQTAIGDTGLLQCIFEASN